MKNLFVLFCMVAAAVAACNNPSVESSSTEDTVTVIPTATAAAPAPASAEEILARPEVPILCYHQIRDYKEKDSRTARAYIVPVAAFAAQMQALADSGYQSILPNQLYDYLVYNKPLPPRPVLISFDDTRLDQYTTALPEMEKHGFKAAFFIMTVSLGRPGYMSTEQVADLHKKGHSIGSHTWDNHDVRKYQEADWKTQIEKPARQLAAITGEPVKYFAYPFGLWNKQALPELARREVQMAFQLADSRDSSQPLLTVRRIIVPGSFNGQGLVKAMKSSFQ